MTFKLQCSNRPKTQLNSTGGTRMIKVSATVIPQFYYEICGWFCSCCDPCQKLHPAWCLTKIKKSLQAKKLISYRREKNP